ncbi:ABC transporter ATP-binding protein [Hominifimenecus sp. rT4P-3]|uniref:ABC transporter ATP-binding protein n=1 Tax=Hominifimenecus sp. rT4P-3 TaxID=3242979 RepID=UPI003DA322C3
MDRAKQGKENVLEMEDLVIHYETDAGVCHAVNHVSLQLKKGQTIGLVGETGAGKTTIALGIMGLIPNPPGRVVGGAIRFMGENLLEMGKAQMRNIRGKKISMIFQDPMTALNPIDTVGDQIREVILLHEHGISKAEATKKACEVLEMVGIPAERYEEYPHQFSGGMKQRIVIAIALACNPELLIADEPTTALDVTIQAQVLDKLNELKEKLGTSMILITHDLGIVAEMCDEVAIVYAGEIVESGSVWDVFDEPTHPYTIGLFGSLPSVAGDSPRLTPIPGLMPDPMNLPEGCSFAPRCPHACDACKKEPQLVELTPGHWVRCSVFGKRKEETNG